MDDVAPLVDEGMHCILPAFLLPLYPSRVRCVRGIDAVLKRCFAILHIYDQVSIEQREEIAKNGQHM